MTSITLISSYFFFYACGDHRDLHSFPTRRSSDLRCDCLAHRLPYLELRNCSRCDPAGDSSGHPRQILMRQKFAEPYPLADRKSTRLNSSHSQISYAVFCLKKKKNKKYKISS